ncbi:MAG: aminoglycoside phosphotransferase [Alphaproteobacteria bacterium]|nr:aminoglycoside phosphotransferase [Alphaproteobacteria bacterium]
MDEALPPAADAARLTDALRRAGVLGDGRVTAVEIVQVRPTILSRITRLRPSYDGAPPDAPTALLIKAPLPERREIGWHGGRHEVAFYTDVAPKMPPGLVPRCFDGAWDDATNDWHLVLEDLTDSHATPTTWPLPPSEADCRRILAAWARVQARWWDAPELGTEIGTWPDEGTALEWLSRLETRVAQLIDQVGDEIPPARRDLFARYIDHAPRLMARYRVRRNLTLVHGDAHVWNCLLPRDPAADDVRLFDWDCWRAGLGADDLSYMMAMHWYPERRQHLERLLLDHFHAALATHGVQNYDRRALDDDYRLAVLRTMGIPVHQAAAGIPPVIWWNNLQRIWLAIDDLDCRALLD